jgi:long-chain fatty acid transport protein
MLRKTLGAACGTSLALVLANGPAHAGGFEYPENGSIAMGRGGAFVARADDPSALMLNTAGMMGAQGLQISVSSNLAFLNHCFTRAGGYQGFNQGVNVATDGTVFARPDGNDYSTGSPGTGMPYAYPQVCNDGAPFPAPQILATYRINRYFAIGVGVYGPNSIGRHDWPDEVMVGNGLRAPSPNRYMLLSENLLILHPTIAIAGAPLPWLRIGIGLQPSFASFEFSTMANALGGQSPDGDIRTTIHAAGWFFAFNAGLQLVAPRFFTVGAHVHYNPEQVTLSGEATATAQYYADPASNRVSSTFTVDQMKVALPLQARWGVRFAWPRDGSLPQTDPNYSPMRDDVFDVEANWIYERSSVFQNLSLANSGSIMPAAGTVVPAPTPLNVPHNFHDIFGFRIGGDVNIVPNRFTARAGVSYEMGAQSRFYGQLDLPAYTMTGLHIGLSVRVAMFTISAAYGGFIIPDFDVINAPGGNISTIGTMGPVQESMCSSGSVGADVCHVNVGHYTTTLHTANLGITARFM